MGMKPMPADLGTVEDRSFVISNFRLQNGAVIAEAKIAYETYGRLAADGGNAVLITHGYTSSHHAAGRSPANEKLPGWWDGLIGPGKAIDTDRLHVVSSNMLGSSFGSTNGASSNPQTGTPYGPDFPAITVRDIVAAEKALLDSLGVKHLIAVAGPSYGGGPGVSGVGGLSRFHGRHCPGGDGPQGSECRAEPRRAAGAARRRPGMERRILLRPGWSQDG